MFMLISVFNFRAQMLQVYFEHYAKNDPELIS